MEKTLAQNSLWFLQSIIPLITSACVTGSFLINYFGIPSPGSMVVAQRGMGEGDLSVEI